MSNEAQRILEELANLVRGGASGPELLATMQYRIYHGFHLHGRRAGRITRRMPSL